MIAPALTCTTAYPQRQTDLLHIETVDYMAKIREQQELVPSVLDRLLDDDPTNPYETPRSRNQILHEMKQSVRRDLENLLNTRWRCVNWPPNLEQLEMSLVNYGLPDFSGAHLGSAQDRERLRQIVEHVIRAFEPRFKTVSVSFTNNDLTDRSLGLRIDALLYAEPAPEPVVFDSQLEATSRIFTVETTGR